MMGYRVKPGNDDTANPNSRRALCAAVSFQ